MIIINKGITKSRTSRKYVKIIKYFSDGQFSLHLNLSEGEKTEDYELKN